MFNMSEKDFSQFGSEISNTQQVLRHSGVHGMSTKVQLFLFNGGLDSNSIDDRLLWPVLNSNES